MGWEDLPPEVPTWKHMPATAEALALVISHEGHIAKLEESIKVLEDAVKRAYRKHWLNDPDIGWHELGEILHGALCNSLGDKGFVEWLNEYRKTLEVKL